MRNLAQYPITKKEIIEYLERIKDELNKELVGDLRPLFINSAIESVSKDKDIED